MVVVGGVVVRLVFGTFVCIPVSLSWRAVPRSRRPEARKLRGGTNNGFLVY